MKPDEIKEEVRKAYTRVADINVGCGCEPEIQTSSSCCGDSSSKVVTSVNLAKALGYDTKNMPLAATESFAGCGNPVALASLKKGEVVLDLGSGAGLDMFVASKKVGSRGKVIGIDMTPAMIEKAKKNAEELGITNVEFRFGDIEEMPIEDDSIDVVISNCVINLAPDKSKVFREANRVLRPGGRIMVSDIVLSKPLPKKVRDEVITYTGCIGGAILDKEYLDHIRAAGFVDVEITGKAGDSLYGAYSAYISARKPE
ncbi:MAG: arsenite S-adenosylmethyltransferase [Candidatus Thorarchaeota archaeon]|nr:MAG: arsenite S-adenosylmethyltransferase [Candidatus Thorarchaeota archaeon]